MNVYKFGGASVRSAEAVRNLLRIISKNDENLFIVISAMDKMTNELEILLNKFFNNQFYDEQLQKIYSFHLNIISQLFNSESDIYNILKNNIDELKNLLVESNKQNYDKTYDSIVSYGEILSTLIISNYLNVNGIKNKWLDAREIISTDDNFRQASVNFEDTSKNINNVLNISDHKIFVLQGFIGSTKNGETTTLGREGSDYTASVIANITNAHSLTLWKDVAGIFNADPKLINNVTKLEKISYREATELAFFGAKIIHPKTAKPLMEKNIELSIRSFTDVSKKGTSVGNFDFKISPVVPIFIYNSNQMLITLSDPDFQFISEDFFEKVFSIFKKFKVRINLFQNSALNLSLCFDNNKNNFEPLFSELEMYFNAKFNQNLTLITIRHFSEDTINKTIENKKILMQQRNRLNAFFLVED